MELTIDEKKTLESILKTEIFEVEDLIKISDKSDADELRTHLAKVVVIPLISIVGGKLVSWLNTKINNEKASSLLTTATNCVINAVRTVLQTYVDTLQAEGKFDEASQKLALLKAKNIALNQMSEEVKVYIENTYGRLYIWLMTQIEATINILKKKVK